MANSHTHAHSRSLIHSHAQKIVILLIKKNCKIYQERQRMAGYHTHHTAIQPHLCIWANVCVCVGIALANGTQQPPWNLNWRDSVAPSDHFVCELNTSFAIRIILYVLVCVCVCEDHIFCVCVLVSRRSISLCERFHVVCAMLKGQNVTKLRQHGAFVWFYTWVCMYVYM